MAGAFAVLELFRQKRNALCSPATQPQSCTSFCVGGKLHRWLRLTASSAVMV